MKNNTIKKILKPSLILENTYKKFFSSEIMKLGLT